MWVLTLEFIPNFSPALSAQVAEFIPSNLRSGILGYWRTPSDSTFLILVSGSALLGNINTNPPALRTRCQPGFIDWSVVKTLWLSDSETAMAFARPVSITSRNFGFNI